MDQQDECNSVNSGGTTSRISVPSKFTGGNERNSCDWVNDLLAVLWEAWADANVFHEKVLQAIYESVNLDRD